MPGKRKMDYHEHDTLPEGDFPAVSGVASASECTGLMHAAPVDRAQLEAYQELSSLEIPKASARKGR